MGHSLVTPANIDELHHTAGDRLEAGGLAMTLAGLLITNMSLLSPLKTCQFDRYYTWRPASASHNLSNYYSRGHRGHTTARVNANSCKERHSGIADIMICKPRQLQGLFFHYKQTGTQNYCQFVLCLIFNSSEFATSCKFLQKGR